MHTALEIPEYNSLTQEMKVEPKLTWDIIRKRKPWSTRSKAFSWSKDSKAPGSIERRYSVRRCSPLYIGPEHHKTDQDG